MTIGVAAPASGCRWDLLRRGLDLLHGWGMETRPVPEASETATYLAASDARRLKGLLDLWTDPSVDVVMCARGGFGSLRLLPGLDFRVLASHPKIFIGFSDITVLLNAVYEHTGVVTFHGPMVSTLPMLDSDSLEAFRRFLASPVVSPTVWRNVEVLHGGTSEGVLKGGNLTVLCHLMGTPYEPDLDGAVILLEDVSEPLYRIDRALTHLKVSGKTESIRGILLGEFSGCGPVEPVWDRVVELWGKPGVAIWGRVPAGHGAENQVLPIGMRVRMDSQSKTVTFLHF